MNWFSYLWIVSLEKVCVLCAVHQDVGTCLFPSLRSISVRPLPLTPAGPVTAAVPHPGGLKRCKTHIRTKILMSCRAETARSLTVVPGLTTRGPSVKWPLGKVVDQHFGLIHLEQNGDCSQVSLYLP